MTIGSQIREAREKQGISLRGFAKRLKVSAPFLSDVERGNRYPSDEILEKFAKALDLDAVELRKLDPRPPVQGLRRLAEEDSRYAAVFRELVKQKVKPEEMESFLKQRAEESATGRRKR